MFVLCCVLRRFDVHVVCGVWPYNGIQKCDFMLFDLSRKSDRNIVDNVAQVLPLTFGFRGLKHGVFPFVSPKLFSTTF